MSRILANPCRNFQGIGKIETRDFPSVQGTGCNRSSFQEGIVPRENALCPHTLLDARQDTKEVLLYEKSSQVHLHL